MKEPDFSDIFAADAQIAAVVKATAALPVLETAKDLYLDLIHSILSQQLSIKASDTIIRRFCAFFPDNYPKADLLLKMPAEKLREAGVSAQKSGYLHSLAAFEQKQGLNLDKLHEMDDEAVIGYLTQVKGVGKWTAEMILIFTLQRPDVFPIDDLAIRMKMVKAYQLSETGKDLRKKLISIADGWKPYRSWMCRYLWKWEMM